MSLYRVQPFSVIWLRNPFGAASLTHARPHSLNNNQWDHGRITHVFFPSSESYTKVPVLETHGPPWGAISSFVRCRGEGSSRTYSKALTQDRSCSSLNNTRRPILKWGIRLVIRNLRIRLSLTFRNSAASLTW